FIVSSIAAIASASSAPSAEITTSAFWPTPKDITPMIDFKFTDLPLYSNVTSELNLLAACTNNVAGRSEEHTSELQSRFDLVCRLLLEKKKSPKIATSRHTQTATPHTETSPNK